jgi:alpha-L-fucosidase
MKTLLYFSILVTTAMCLSPHGSHAADIAATDVSQASWESLAQHPAPDWFRDAKFGIYAHWGVYCVPGYNSEWYPKRMYIEDSPVYKHHLETYGDPNRFGYKEFIPLFKAENFDAREWAELYEKAGARFAGPVVEHHDGFSMWASTVNRWNAAEMGPKRDVTGELVQALRERGIKTVTTFHHGLNVFNWYPTRPGSDTADPRLADLYGKFAEPEEGFRRWLAKVKEVVDQYQPDQLWFDIGLARIPQVYKQEMVQYYYDQAKTWGKEVLITKKRNDLPNEIGVLDIERGKMSGLAPFVWQTDDSIARNSWGWVQGLEVKPARELIHHLIDIVSKNGVLMLNVCPQADGSFPEDQREILHQIGVWLQVNGEAIYGSHPWVTHGQGPQLFSQGGTNVHFEAVYSDKDIRFTRKGDILYAIVLNWPQAPVLLDAVRIDRAAAHARVSLLGYERPLSYTRSQDKTLVVTMPQLTAAERPCQHACVLKLEGFVTRFHPDAAFADGRAISLSPRQVLLEGGHRSYSSTGQDNDYEFVRFQTNSQGRIHWLVDIPKAATYALRARVAPFKAPDRMVIELNGQSLSFIVPKTASWRDPALVDVGRIELSRPGIYQLVLHTGNPKQANKQTMAVWEVLLAALN